MKLEGKVAVVTGAGSGIGRAVALQMLAAGGQVVIVDLDRTAAEQVGAPFANALAVGADVSDAASVAGLFAQVDARFGALHYLVNNAGVLGGPRFPAAAVAAWMRAIQVNLVGTLHCIEHAVPLMRRGGGGAIVNTASTSGLTPNPVDPVDAATKAAIVNLTRSLTFLATEDRIRVNCVCPALVRTPLERNSADNYSAADKEDFLQRRAGRTGGPALAPEEVAEQIVRLLVDEELAGYACRMVAGGRPELIAPPAPQRL